MTLLPQVSPAVSGLNDKLSCDTNNAADVSCVVQPQLSILTGDSLATLKTLPDKSVHCTITSPPYFKQRDYGVEGQCGQEGSIEEYIKNQVVIYREFRRVLHPSGTFWLNIGDSYAKPGIRGVRPKNLCQIPARLSLALQDDGWNLRSQIVWHKTAAMPESVTDRPVNAWEPIYLFSKAAHYYYDAEAVKEDCAKANVRGAGGIPQQRKHLRNVWRLGPEPYHGSHCAPFPSEIPRKAILAGTSEKGCCPQCLAPWKRLIEKTRILGVHGGLRKRADAPGAVTSATSVFRDGAATITKTIGWRPTCTCGITETIPCTVLDMFGGTGTVGQVAAELGRSAILIELNPEFVRQIHERLGKNSECKSTSAKNK